MGWSLIQASAAGIQSSAVVQAFSSNVTSGNLLVAIFGSYAGSYVPTIGDTQGNAWSLAVSKQNKCAFYYATAKASGANTVTATIAGTDWIGLNIAEYAFAGATAFSLDGTATATGGSQTTPSGTVPVSGSDELVVCGYSQASSTYIHSPGVGFTQAAANTNGLNYCATYQDYQLDANSDQADSSQFTTAFFSNWYSASASFKASGVGGGSSVVFRRSLSALGTRVGCRQSQYRW